MKKNADLICAGFPCQPFSKAGSQNGFDHKIAGDMFQYLFSIIKYVRPEYIFLENVPNLFFHNSKKTYRKMKMNLEQIGYTIKEKQLAPIDFCYPQTRQRLYIVGINKKKNKEHDSFEFPLRKINLKKDYNHKNIGKFLSKNPRNVEYVFKAKAEKIEMFQDLLNRLEKKHGRKIISSELMSPLWLMEFDANYPINGTNTFNKDLKNFIGYKGSFGKRIKMKNGELINLPAYAKTKKKFPNLENKFHK